MAMTTQKLRNSANETACGFRVEGMSKCSWSLSRTHLMPLRVSEKEGMALEQQMTLITDSKSNIFEGNEKLM